MSVRLILDDLELILKTIEIIEERFKDIKTSDDLVTTPYGVTTMDSIAMRLQTIGENLKKIEKMDANYLKKYSGIDWVSIIKLRDLISHHYLNIDHEMIYSICKNKIPDLKTEITRMLKEFEN